MMVLDKLKKNKEKNEADSNKVDEDFEQEVVIATNQNDNETKQIVEEVQSTILGQQLSGKKNSEEQLPFKKNISKDTESVLPGNKITTETGEPNQKKTLNSMFFTPQMKTTNPADLPNLVLFQLEKRAFVIGVNI
jgi:hypothetical protein